MLMSIFLYLYIYPDADRITASPLSRYDPTLVKSMLSWISVSIYNPTSASVEHHGVQPTGCMDNEPEPSRGVPCLAFPGRPANSGSTLPRTAHLDGGVIGNHQSITSHSKCTLASFDMALSRMPTKHQLHPCLHPTHHSHNYHTHAPTVTNPTAFHAQL